MSLSFVSEFNRCLDSLATTSITQNNWHHGGHSEITSMYHQLTSQKQHGGALTVKTAPEWMAIVHKQTTKEHDRGRRTTQLQTQETCKRSSVGFLLRHSLSRVIVVQRFPTSETTHKSNRENAPKQDYKPLRRYLFNYLEFLALFKLVVYAPSHFMIRINFLLSMPSSKISCLLLEPALVSWTKI